MSATVTASKVPAHVPPELVWDRNLEQFQSELGDPFLAASRLHDGPDIFWATKLPHGRSGWVITRQALQQEAFVDTVHFSSKGGSGIGELLGQPFDLIPVEIDPPLHTAYRRILNPYFTPVAVKKLDGSVRETCDTLISRFEDRGGCELISEFAVPFPSYVFLALVGLPAEEAPQFLKWEEEMFRGENPQVRITAMRAVMVYLQNFIKEQQAEPKTELVRALVSATIDGRPIADNEILGILYTFYVGGLDTVYSTIGWTMRHLARNPELQSRLRADPDLVPNAVDEFARAFSVVSTIRHVASDIDFHGVSMRAGDLVLFPLYLAGRDPKAFTNPHEIDPERRSRALTFASGPHLCLGRELARREMRVALAAFLTRFDNIHVPEDEAYSYHAGVTFGIDRLSLAWTRPG
jgi:cytochrome P450